MVNSFPNGSLSLGKKKFRKLRLHGDPTGDQWCFGWWDQYQQIPLIALISMIVDIVEMEVGRWSYGQSKFWWLNFWLVVSPSRPIIEGWNFGAKLDNQWWSRRARCSDRHWRIAHILELPRWRKRERKKEKRKKKKRERVRRISW